MNNDSEDFSRENRQIYETPKIKKKKTLDNC